MKAHHLILAAIITACSTKSSNKFLQTSGFKQIETSIDSSFAKFKVDKITACYTTLTDLGRLNIDLREIKKDSLDDFFKTYSHQSDHFYLSQEKGLLIGTYDYTEIINTFWLTEKFNGTLSDKLIDNRTYTVSQMTRDFPEPRFRWTTTGVSPYWIYTNDTISFFVTVDTAKQRFPLDENYYKSHRMAGIQLELSCWKIYGPTYAQGDTVHIKPLYSPLTETHTNYFLLQRQPGIGTTIREIFSAGKKTTLIQKRIGLWFEYSPDHKIKSKELHKDGEFIKVE